MWRKAYLEDGPPDSHLVKRFVKGVTVKPFATRPTLLRGWPWLLTTYIRHGMSLQVVIDEHLQHLQIAGNNSPKFEGSKLET